VFEFPLLELGLPMLHVTFIPEDDVSKRMYVQCSVLLH
jgi:hypothetical protein